MKKKTVAIIGSNVNAVIFANRAKLLNLRTICFAWNNCLDAKELVDEFYLTDTFRLDYIIDICKKENVQGVLCATESALYDTAYIAYRLGLVCNSIDASKNVTNKIYVREKAKDLNIIKMPDYIFLPTIEDFDLSSVKKYPAIVKPVCGTAKKGITVVSFEHEMKNALDYAFKSGVNYGGALIEEFLDSGEEYSVESISFDGRHHVIQLTYKISSGPPHCVELEHHQGIDLPGELYEKVVSGIDELLTRLGIAFGPCHTEIKIIGDTIYLIEINARMGGGGIAYPLTELSTGYPYITAIILCCLNIFLDPAIFPSSYKKYAGIYYVVKQNEYLKPILDSCDNEDWFLQKQVSDEPLIEVKTNYERKNWFMYLSNNKMILK